MPRGPRRPRGSEVRTMVSLCLLSSLGCAFGVAAPMTPQAPVRLDAALGALALLMAGGLWVAAPASSRGWLHPYLATCVAAVSWLVSAAHTPAGAVTIAVSDLWCVLYAAFFTSRRLTAGYTAAAMAGLAAAFGAHPFPGVIQVWVLLAATTTALAAIVAGLVDRLHALAVTDPLTGLLNRAGLAPAAARELAHATRTGRPVGLALIDLDGFKQVNDRDGHAAGDRLLTDLARAWAPLLRSRDILARHGGDEFVLMVPDTDGANLHKLLHRLRTATPVAWSAGTVIADPGEDLDALLRRADRRLYQAKTTRPLPAGRFEASLEAPTVIANTAI